MKKLSVKKLIAVTTASASVLASMPTMTAFAQTPQGEIPDDRIGLQMRPQM